MAQPRKTMILSPQQQRALDQLLPVARIATSGIRAGLPVLPRTHSLLIGPSGSGKSHLARHFGSMLGIPTLVINVATWGVISSRAEPWSVTQIADWLDRLPAGGILVLDEIDKLQSDSDWNRYVRLEIHDILDGTIPAAAKLPSDEIPAECFPPSTGMDYREFLARKLREKVMIIGCGAWQSAWRCNSKTMGFTSGVESILPEPPSREQILASIDSELRQRFRDEITLLSPMLVEDYARVAQTIAKQIPPELQTHWNKELGSVLRRAADGSLGMRAMEELLLKALLLSGKGNEPELISEPQKLRPQRAGPEPLW